MDLRTTMSRRTVAALAGMAIAAAVLLSPATRATGATKGSLGGIERLRYATGAYHNEALALAAGFKRTDECVASPAGGMGYHYVNPTRIQDDAVHRDKPEILLYERPVGNERKLVGVEYFKVDQDQDLSTDGDRPKLFGRPFDGPMPGHEPGMPVHYDLHVWVWANNPDGLFAPFNPRVRCPK